MALTQVTPITEDELSAILSGKADSIITPPKEEEKQEETKEEKIEEKPTQGFKKTSNVDFTWQEFEEEKKEEEQEDETIVSEKKDEPVKPGRKPSDIVSMVNDLVTNGELFGFEDGEVKTIEDAKELIKLNVQEAKKTTDEDVWSRKVKTYSPQVQAVLQYAEKGGQDLSPLIAAISEVEKVTDHNIETESGQENIIREYYTLQGWKDDEIKEEIETAKDLNKLKSKAEKFLPKILETEQQRIESIMVEQEQRQLEMEEARNKYLSTIKTTLDKEKLGDVQLTRQEKAVIWDGLTDVRYASWSGQPTNLFFKTLEELQAGDKADYDRFLEVVFLTLNRSAFKDKIKKELNNQNIASTVRQLKVQESKKANTSENFLEENENKKPSIKRQAFKNPWG